MVSTNVVQVFDILNNLQFQFLKFLKIKEHV
jgi:hypothetical protein